MENWQREAQRQAGSTFTSATVFSPLPAFLYGWTLFLVISSGSIATLAVAFSAYLSEIVPLTPVLSKVIAVAMIGIVTLINVLGTRESANVQNWTTAIKVGAILIMSAVLLWLGRGFSGGNTNLWPTEAGASLAAGFGLAMIGVLWAYEGWQYVTFSAGETVNAQRNFPRALLTGSAALIVIYLLANVAYLAALGPTKAAQTDSIAATAVTAVVGPWTREAGCACHSDLDLQCGERDRFDRTARLLRDGP